MQSSRLGRAFIPCDNPNPLADARRLNDNVPRSPRAPRRRPWMRRSRYRFDPDDPLAPHFLTCTAVAWLPVFSRPEAVGIVVDSWRYLQANEGFELFGYVILENHLHLIAAGVDLSKMIGRFKSYTARRI